MLDRMLLSAGADEKNYIEDLFSTYLYAGNGSTQTITNGIDLAGKGGLVWIKARSNASDHGLYDTNRGTRNVLSSSQTGAQYTSPVGQDFTAFNANGFSLNAPAYYTSVNDTGTNYTSWTFRKAPKFFDVVTFTGTSSTNQRIAHSLGSVPGCIIIKRTSGDDNWFVYHRTQTRNDFLMLQSTAAKSSITNLWGTSDPTATDFGVSGNNLVASGATYVAYLFAHDATADGIIQCGSFTTDGSGNATVNLGWEPQWLLGKSTSTGPWVMADTMRGMTADNSYAYLLANTSGAEATSTSYGVTSTGFTTKNLNASQTYIYVAIRRGPMKTPTVGTSVFLPSTVGATNNITVGFPADTAWFKAKNDVANWRCFDRLRSGYELATNLTSAEGTFNYAPTYIDWDSNSVWYQNLQNYAVDYFFRRAPGFFDVVCYTGTGVARTVNHNLGVAPELMILKSRSGGETLWYTYWSQLGIDKMVRLNTTDPAYSGFSGILNNTVPSATTFSLATANSDTNNSGTRYVAYLFASCPGVSKVGSYTGNGSSQTINCGFSSGARFFLVKASSASGDWWVYDSARGIVAAADPALRLNSDAAEVASADAVDTDSTGIIVNQEATCNINVNGATYIYLAIA